MRSKQATLVGPGVRPLLTGGFWDPGLCLAALIRGLEVGTQGRGIIVRAFTRGLVTQTGVCNKTSPRGRVTQRGFATKLNLGDRTDRPIWPLIPLSDRPWGTPSGPTTTDQVFS